MALDPEEFVALTDHGTMKPRSAVSRAMTLLSKERKRATIVREGDPAVLNFDQIKDLAGQWDNGSCRSTDQVAVSDRGRAPRRWPVHDLVTPTEPYNGGAVLFCPSQRRTK